MYFIMNVSLVSDSVWWGFPSGSAVKNLPAMQDTWVQKTWVLIWRIPWTEEPEATVHGVAKGWT